MRILITAIGSMSSEAVIASLRKNPENYIVGCDTNPKDWIAPSMLVDAFYQVPVVANKIDYLNKLISICTNENIEYVLPLTDPEVDIISENLNIFIKNSIKVCISDYSTIKICRDKLLLYEFFKYDDFVKIIPTYDACSIKYDQVEFPLIAKPKKGRSSEGIFRIHSANDLKYFFSSFSINDYILQPLLTGDIYTVDFIRCKTSDSSFSIVRQELIRTVNGAGLTVKIKKEDTISQLSDYIGRKIKINGCVNFEFIKHDKQIYLMDINPRFSAGLAFSMLAGYDFVNNHIKCFIGKEIDPKIEYNERIISKRYHEIIINQKEK